MNFHEYFLEFVKISKYAPYLLSDPIDQMRRFVAGVSEDLQDECRSSMLHDNMKISRFMVYARRVKEERDKRKSRDAKRARSLMESPQGIVLRYAISLNLRSEVQIKYIQNPQELVVIGWLTLNLRMEKLLIH